MKSESREEKRLRPRLNLSQIYGPGLIFSPRASPNACTWLPSASQVVSDNMTGGQFSVAGTMPVVCSAGVSTPEGLQLLRDAGFEAPPVLLRYFDASDYLRLLKKLCQKEKQLAFQYVHPASEFPSENYWVKPETLSFLNSKVNLATLVSHGHIPLRHVVARDRLDSGVSSSRFPLVVKAVTDEPTGGGCDVVICREPSDLPIAVTTFRSCVHVVVEEFLPIKLNLCLNYAATAGGVIDYLGCAEQVCDAQGKYKGNWIDPEIQAPPLAVEIGTKVVAAGVALRYYGCVGIDMGVLEDDRIVAFDLNFRVNGSTTPLLLAESVRAHLGKTIFRFRRMQGNSTYRNLLKSVYAAMKKGIFLPLATFDPEAGGYFEAPPRLNGLILGNTREEVEEHERELSTIGLS